MRRAAAPGDATAGASPPVGAGRAHQVVADIADDDADADHGKAAARVRFGFGGGAAGGGVGRPQLMGLDVTPELCAIALVYFVQGILGLSRLALSFYFKDELHVDPAQVAVLQGIAMMPWVVKPLYGFISDSVPLFGYRRRSYLAVCGLFGATSWLALAVAVHSPAGAVAAMMLGSLSTAASDVVVDSIVVERARGAPEGTTGSLQSLCWAFQSLGGVASAYFSGSLVQAWGVHPVFAATAVFPLLVSVSALLIDEKRIVSPPPLPAAGLLPTSAGGDHLAAAPGCLPPDAGAALAARVATQGRALWGAVRRKDILLPTIFVFLWQATPSADTAMFYFYTNHLHFEPEFLGRVRLAGSVASLAGVAIYNTFLKKVPLKRMFWWAMVSGTALGATQLVLVSGANRALGLSDKLFVLGDSVILTVLGQVSFMPVLVLAARLCPEGVEATLFATLMSIMNGGAFIGSALGGGLTAALGVTSDDFDNLFTLTAICVASTMLPAPFLSLLPSSVDRDGGGGGEGGGGEGGKADKGREEGAGEGDEEEGAALLGRREHRDGGDGGGAP
ncbi:MAG: BT1 family-domain-containing protein [Monoraphidium minutum]|nr:MAG: BT1 family-domain-containing protein [Monoraphidium minutum]